MKWHEQHEAFKKLMVQGGIQHADQLNRALPFGTTVPTIRMHRWMRDMLKVPSSFSNQPRWINRFKLGADPEFVFIEGGVRIDASALGLQQGLAFGMDNNGRLIEVRPHPSRSAVKVVASLLSALRWLVVFKPGVLKPSWTAGAYLLGDGLGGHVHFGRKRPGRDLEVRALDTLEEELLHLKAYPVGEVMRRRQGDEHHNAPYGLPGDIRKQLHGYEYRTFPSWLDSPELAFLTLVMSKLAVHNPNLFQGYEPLNVERQLQRMRNLLSVYKDVDDDARLALLLLSRKMPVHIGGDFKSRWGLPADLTGVVLPEVKFIPCAIKPSDEDVVEMFEYLMGKKTLGWRVPTPTWSPLVPPEHYVLCINSVNTRGAKGLGEMLWDIATHKSVPFAFYNTADIGGGAYFSIPSVLARQLPNGWHKFCNNKVSVHHGESKVIYSSMKARVDHLIECRRILLETVFPFWRITDIKKDSYQQWQTAHQKQRAEIKFSGKLLYGSVASLPLK